MNVAELLSHQALQRPSTRALIDVKNGRTRTLTFAELDRATSQAAALLRTSAIGVGDAVLVFHPMSIELYVALLGIFRLGAVAMFIDPSAGRAHIERCCALYPPRAFLGNNKAQLLRLVSTSIRQIPIKITTGIALPRTASWSECEHIAAFESIECRHEDDAALVTFTSGSTGMPKCAVRTHGFLLAQHAALERTIFPRSTDVDMPTMPIFVLDNLASGVTSVIANANLTRPGFIDAQPVVEQIVHHHINRMTASPALCERLVEYCETKHITIDSMEKILTGGAPVFPNLLRRLQTVFPNAVLYPTYGSTEAEPIAHIEFDNISADDMKKMFSGRGLLAGTPIPQINLRIIRDKWGTPLQKLSPSDLDALTLPMDQPGEIIVSGEHVLPGYLHGQGDADNKIAVDGHIWHRTGDAGYLDHNGRLWLLGRCSAIVHDRNGPLYPFAVECAASIDPAVKRSALIAVDGRRILCVELHKGEQLDGETFNRTLSWAQLDEIQIQQHIPIDKRHNAKIDYPELRRLLARTAI